MPAGLVIMQSLLSKGAAAVDFRIVRTDRKNVIITATVDEAESVKDIELFAFKKTRIEKVEPGLKNFFQF